MLIVGGGFAGLGCALELARSKSPVQITLVDRHNYHQFQPLFYQLATSQLSVNDVTFSLRRICRDQPAIDIKLGEVDKVDPETRRVHTKDGDTWIWDYFLQVRGSQLLDRSDAARIDWFGDGTNDKATVAIAGAEAAK